MEHSISLVDSSFRLLLVPDPCTALKNIISCFCVFDHKNFISLSFSTKFLKWLRRVIPELFFVSESRVQSGSGHQATGRLIIPRSRLFFLGGGGGGGGAVRDIPKTAARETTEQVDKTT